MREPQHRCKCSSGKSNRSSRARIRARLIAVTVRCWLLLVCVICVGASVARGFSTTPTKTNNGGILALGSSSDYSCFSVNNHSEIRDDASLANELLRSMNECWETNSWTLTSNNLTVSYCRPEQKQNLSAKDSAIDQVHAQILGHLVSPAPQSYYVLNRAIQLYQQTMPSNQEKAMTILQSCIHLLKDGRSLLIRKQRQLDDQSLFQPGKDWTVVLDKKHHYDQQEPENMKQWDVLFTAPPTKRNYTSVTTLANQILDTAIAHSITSSNDRSIQPLAVVDQQHLDQLRRRLFTTLGTDIRGRTAADAALALALSGVVDDVIYRGLYRIARLELERTQRRRQQRKHKALLRDMLHICEKVAASGALPGDDTLDHDDDDDDVLRIYQIVAQQLLQSSSKDFKVQQKQSEADTAASLLSTYPSPTLDLLHPRPLLWLWRFSSRLTKPQLQATADFTQYDGTSSARSITTWTPSFEDNHRPLILDLGCGLGVSLLGLATQSVVSAMAHVDGKDVLGIRWSDCNFLGCDANPLTIRFASGLSQRWTNRLGPGRQRLEYCNMSTEDLLDEVAANYPGPVALVLLQFPTPFRLKNDADANKITADNGPMRPQNFNTQLPDSPTSPTFMASKLVLRRIAQLLQQQTKVGPRGRLLVQSNCEDVAIQIRDMAIHEGFQCVPSPFPVVAVPTTERTQRWLQQQKLQLQGGDGNTTKVFDAVPLQQAVSLRAVGGDWWSEPILSCAPTETEAACALQGTPVHRCLLEI